MKSSVNSSFSMKCTDLSKKAIFFGAMILFTFFGISINAQKIYIDPTFAGTSDGSIEKPYSSISFNWNSNTSYYFKRGTTINTSGIDISGDHIYIGAYGVGDRPMFKGKNKNAIIKITGVQNKIQGIQVVTTDTLTGAGIQMLKSGRNYIDDCKINGALHGINGTSSRLEISHCEVINSYFDGMYLNSSDTLVLLACHIHDMYSSGGNSNSVDCIHSQDNKIVFVDSVLSDHSNFEGKYAFIGNGYDSIAIKNSTFIGSPSNGSLFPGGGTTLRFRWYMENCKILGGKYGLQNNATIFYLKNCIFKGQVENAVYEGGYGYIYNCDFIDQKVAIRNWHAQIRELKNCIFYNFDYALAGMYGTITNNCFYTTSNLDKTSSWGDNYINKDPLFASYWASDFQLKNASPCINAGTEVPLNFDFTGLHRPEGSAIDIGAYESYGNITAINERDNPKPKDGLLIYPNPSSGHVTIVFESPAAKNQKIAIYNVMGKMVHETNVAEGILTLDMDLSLDAGQYIVSVTSDVNHAGTTKLIMR